MKHYLYKITNKETNQFYIGVRSHKFPEKDKYMGSSSVWTKQWIKDNKEILIKEILNDSFENRELANTEEVNLLQKYESDELCINCLYARIPSHLGVKQSEEWIRKRIKSGKEANMYGKHHTEETKQKISEKLKGRIVSKEAREKIGKTHKGKIVSKETRNKLSKTRKRKIASGEIKKTYKPVIVKDLELNTVEYYEGCKIFADKFKLNYGSVKSSARKGTIYLKRYKITYAASISDDSRTFRELLEHLEEGNQQPSLEKDIVVSKKVQRLDGEESTNNPSTSAEHL